MRSDAKNLEAIVAAINKHNLRCPNPATAVALSPFEHERLGWDEIAGLPIVEDSELGSGVFRVLCDGDATLGEITEETRKRDLVAV